MRSWQAAEAKQNLGRLVDAARSEPQVVMRHSEPVGVVMSMSHYHPHQRDYDCRGKAGPHTGAGKLDGIGDPRVRRREQPRLQAKLEWYGVLRSRFADRIEPIDVDVAERGPDVSVSFPSLRDGDKAILATALVRGYGVATRNRGDFRNSGVALVDPFDPDTWS